ncbi:chloride channel protein 2-like isoform X2 [Stegodyphus dumicola]|uniref:chloride channel protein 2-like isoform X2 n=1 Tax=Stegodyphus dumicola TaxID=202533 RepID=UPI0015B13A0A|nr:chloride channel protein 2-like isoform X2 [Stegodyphus dumicola]
MSDGTERAALGYEHTLMFGQYREDLGEYAKLEALRVKSLEKLRKKEEKRRQKELKPYRNAIHRKLVGLWQNTFARLGEDWFFLAFLGVISSLLSFSMDYAISMCQKSRIWLYRDLTAHPFLQYLAWVALPMCLILFSAGFVHITAPQAIGSGIPEMKTILRGVVLKEYLSFRTLISKVIGLTCTLGSGMPLGKEGPFVHISSILATILSKLVTSFKGIHENESRANEMLAAACAVGVACSFAAPIGGVLFSIEVTSVYFAVRNYWRGFFAACCGAMVWRLLGVWFKNEETLTAIFRTNFHIDFPFDPQELIVFAGIGAVCGLGGAFFVWFHRQIVHFNRKHKRMNAFLQKNRFIYPALITLIISTMTFPLGLGQFMAAELTTHESMNELFSNVTWSNHYLEVDEAIIVSHWTTKYTNIFVNLVVFIIITFITTTLAATLPVPSGLFIPVFKMGAAFGRLVGECMASWFPDGITLGGSVNRIIPGGYAVVGAAALSGSVTHTISTSVIVFELTGQMSHILPVILAVLIANGISQALQPSIYDSIIQIKKLPYLPPIVSTSSEAHNVYVADIMVRDVVSVWRGCTYKDLRSILKLKKRLQFFPLVESLESMILLGSIQRIELLRLLELQVGRERRLQEAAKRAQLTESPKTPRAEKKLSRFEVVPVVSSTRSNPYPGQESIDSRLKQAFETVFKKTLTVDPFDKFESSVPSTPTIRRSQQPKILVDMSPEEQLAWEEDQLNQLVDFSKCHVDPAPFQLVERTTLIKVHSLFSMLGLNYAYVTAIGRLVGVVALKELRKAIENISSGLFVQSSNHFNQNEKSEPPSETQSECEDNADIGKVSVMRQRNQDDGSNV